MRLTRRTDFALRILLQAAAEPDILHAIGTVADIHGISRNHVMKIVNDLSRAGLLKTVRGRSGGFTLARPPETINLGDVVRLTEPDLRPANCGECALQGRCGLTGILGAALGAFLASLDQKTLADALAGSQKPLFL